MSREPLPGLLGEDTQSPVAAVKFSGSNKMSIQTPPTLEKLARKALLRDEALAISALEGLPKRLFLPLFQEACNCRLRRILRAMVAVWPFCYLPVAVLMDIYKWDILQPVMEGLRVLLRQHDHPMKWNLRILDYRTVHNDIWAIEAGTEDGDCSAETVVEKQGVKSPPRYEQRQRVKLITDLYSRFTQERQDTESLPGAQHRKDSLQIHCVNMKIMFLSLGNFWMFQSVLQLQKIEVLEITIDQTWSALSCLSPDFIEMRNLHTVSLVFFHRTRLCQVFKSNYKRLIPICISEFSSISGLLHLYMNGIPFLRGHMRHLLRNLKNRLESFSITHCQLFRLDLRRLSECQHLCQLKHLNMSGVLLSNFCLMPLRVLLQKVADTLETLELEGCGINDSQLSVLLLALSQCSKLTKVNFYTNDFSMNVLSDLLQHTATLSNMTMEQYPAPRECYELGLVSIERFEQFCPVLMDTLRGIRQPKSISFATDVCSRCSKRCVYEQETRLCSCLQ